MTLSIDVRQLMIESIEAALALVEVFEGNLRMIHCQLRQTFGAKQIRQCP